LRQGTLTAKYSSLPLPPPPSADSFIHSTSNFVDDNETYGSGSLLYGSAVKKPMKKRMYSAISEGIDVFVAPPISDIICEGEDMGKASSGKVTNNNPTGISDTNSVTTNNTAQASNSEKEDCIPELQSAQNSTTSSSSRTSSFSDDFSMSSQKNSSSSCTSSRSDRKQKFFKLRPVLNKRWSCGRGGLVSGDDDSFLFCMREGDNGEENEGISDYY